MADDKVYLPKQKVRRGAAGYKGKNIVVIDSDTGQPTTNSAAKSKSKRR